MPTENMAMEDSSHLTFDQLRERFDNLVLRLKYNLVREMPVTGLYAEIRRTITALDQHMEQYKSTPVYDHYQREREALSALFAPVKESTTTRRR